MKQKLTPILLVIAMLLSPLALHADVQAARLSQAAVSGIDATDNITGSAMPRDVDTGTPSLNSDSLVIQLSGIQSPPAPYGVQGYLLEDADGLAVGQLPVAGGSIDTVRDFPGNNLVGNYNTFRMMWEETLFEDVLPAEALGYIRQVVYRADDTPGNIGYGVGLIREARTMQTHANFAREAANRGNLGEAKLHAEHVLNILYGRADPRHDDYDGDGVAENPGDGFGLLRYADKVYFNMSYVAESTDGTEQIIDQAFATLAVLSNFSPAEGTGTWADSLVVLAHEILVADSVDAAQPSATALRNLAVQIRDGIDANDNGEIEAIEGEGGAWTAFFAAQAAAHYFSSGGITGSVYHLPSGTNPTSDQLTIELNNVPQPPAGDSLWGYLVDEQDNLLFLGELPWNNNAVEVSLPFQGRNLIGGFSGFRLTQGTIYAQNTRPAASLTPIRNTLAGAGDTPGGIGYGPGLVQQSQLLRDSAAQIPAAVSANNLAMAKAHAEATLNVLVGEGDPRFRPDADNPGDGFGVLGHAAGVDLAMLQASDSPGATENILLRASQASAAIANFSPATGTGTWADQLITQLQNVLGATTPAQATEPASQAATLANQILNGQAENGGARAAYLAAQRTADYFPGEAETPEPSPAPGPNPDAHENDDLCELAKTIPTDGTPQRRNFHYEGDQDWARFTAQAGKSYVIEVTGVGERADPVIFLFDTCASPPGSFESNAFGNSVRLTWNATRSGAYYIQLRQFDPAVFGSGTGYDLSVTLDTVPPSPPTNLRCLSIDQTTVGLQWRRSPEFDVAAYRVTFGNEAATDTGIRDVDGAATTFVELDGLTANELYFLRVRALDFSRNESDPSGEIQCRPVQPTDQTQPVIDALQPAQSGTYTTTAPVLTLSGAARDPGGNLSRVQVHNASIHQTKSDFTLSGAASEFRIEDLPLRVGSNDLQVTVFDESNNTSTRNLQVVRLAQSPGAVVIVAGHNETFGLQTNIYNATNRAYRVFQSAGFTDDDIYYLAPVGQDATGDGATNTRNEILSPAAVESALTEWAKARVGPGKPLYLYFMDHGFADRYCVTGCTPGNVITPEELDGWIHEVEEATGVDEVNIFIEACQSGSFLDSFEGETQNPNNSLSRQGRVVVTSTGRVNNAYASADGAYFSDTFFSCLADSQSIKACFDEGATAVALAGVDQTPWLDDNGDGLFNENDGTVASQRTVTRFFSSVRPRITSTNVTVDGTSGVLSAQVEAGAEEVRVVWAALYPPSFQEPGETTLNLNVPLVRLEPVSDSPGLYRFNYINGFSESGDYRIIFYAQDRLGIHAPPVREGDAPEGHDLYIPGVSR